MKKKPVTTKVRRERERELFIPTTILSLPSFSLSLLLSHPFLPPSSLLFLSFFFSTFKLIDDGLNKSEKMRRNGQRRKKEEEMRSEKLRDEKIKTRKIFFQFSSERKNSRERRRKKKEKEKKKERKKRRKKKEKEKKKERKRKVILTLNGIFLEFACIQ